MIRLVIILAALAATLYLAACALLFVRQRALIYFPQPAAFATPQATLVLPVDGGQVRVSVRPHAGPKALLYFGGNAEDVSYNLAGFAAALPDRAFYLMHYRGYGGSSGVPSEAAILRDAVALFDTVHAEHADIAIVGRSLGSGVAIHVAGLRPATRLVLVTPYDSLQELAAAQFPYFPVRWLLRDKYESWRYAPLITAPTLVVAAGQDDIVPLSSTQRLYARFGKGVATFLQIPDTTHNTIGDNPRYLAALRDAL